MKAKELIQILKLNPEAEVLVCLEGSVFPTTTLSEHIEYNQDVDDEVFVLALEEFQNG